MIFVKDHIAKIAVGIAIIAYALAWNWFMYDMYMRRLDEYLATLQP
jgi:hypothetical protein